MFKKSAVSITIERFKISSILNNILYCRGRAVDGAGAGSKLCGFAKLQHHYYEAYQIRTPSKALQFNKKGL
jgi:hypothetical protein